MSASFGHTVIVHVPNLTSDISAHAEPSPARAIVCRPALVDNYRIINPGATLFTPGIRLEDMSADDHATPSKTSTGDYVVVGRPITRSPNPREMYLKFCDN